MYKRREFTEDEKKLSEKIRNLLVQAEDAMLHANLAIAENSMIDV